MVGLLLGEGYYVLPSLPLGAGSFVSEAVYFPFRVGQEFVRHSPGSLPSEPSAVIRTRGFLRGLARGDTPRTSLGFLHLPGESAL